MRDKRAASLGTLLVIALLVGACAQIPPSAAPYNVMISTGIDRQRDNSLKLVNALSEAWIKRFEDAIPEAITSVREAVRMHYAKKAGRADALAKAADKAKNNQITAQQYQALRTFIESDDFFASKQFKDFANSYVMTNHQEQVFFVLLNETIMKHRLQLDDLKTQMKFKLTNNAGELRTRNDKITTLLASASALQRQQKEFIDQFSTLTSIPINDLAAELTEFSTRAGAIVNSIKTAEPNFKEVK